MCALELAVFSLVVATIAAVYAYTVLQETTQQGYRLEVEPTRAVAVKDIFGDEADNQVFFQGTHTLRLGRDEVFAEVSLQNETWNPGIMWVRTKDGVQLGVNLVVTKQKVKRSPEDVLKAVMSIKYEERNAHILPRLLAALQDSIGQRIAEEFYAVTAEGKTEVRDDVNDKIEKEVNPKLVEEITTPWGIEEEVGIENIVLPPHLVETAEAASAAQKAGEAAAIEIDKSRVDPNVFYISKALQEIASVWRGGKK